MLNAYLPVFGTGIVLAEQVFALGIASQPAETDAAIDPVAEKQTPLLSIIIQSKTFPFINQLGVEPGSF